MDIYIKPLNNKIITILIYYKLIFNNYKNLYNMFVNYFIKNMDYIKIKKYLIMKN